MSLLYINKIPGASQAAFTSKLEGTAQRLGVSPNWLMQVFKAESGVNPQAVNPNGGATGLIQFMPETARGLGTTTAALRNMTALQQLYYVEKYFLPYAGRMKNYYDVYAVTFFPAMVGKPDNWVMQTSKLSAALIARQNPAININKDGKITVAEFKQYVKNTVQKSYWDIVFGAAEQAAAPVAGAIAALFFFIC